MPSYRMTVDIYMSPSSGKINSCRDVSRADYPRVGYSSTSRFFDVKTIDNISFTLPSAVVSENFDIYAIRDEGIETKVCTIVFNNSDTAEVTLIDNGIGFAGAAQLLVTTASTSLTSTTILHGEIMYTPVNSIYLSYDAGSYIYPDVEAHQVNLDSPIRNVKSIQIDTLMSRLYNQQHYFTIYAGELNSDHKVCDITQKWKSYSHNGLSLNVCYYEYEYTENAFELLSGESKIFVETTGISTQDRYACTLLIQYVPKESTVGYYNGSSFVECVANYYDGTQFIQCDPYRYNGTEWIPCNAT